MLHVTVNRPVDHNSYLETVKNPASAMTHRSEHVQHRAACDLAGLIQGLRCQLRQRGALEEHRRGVTSGVCRDALLDLDGVVGEKVVEDHLAGVAEHVVLVVPYAVEAQHVTVVVQELFEGVDLFVWAQRLLGFVHLLKRIYGLDRFKNTAKYLF